MIKNFIFIVIVGLLSCSAPPPPKVKLTKDDYVIVDSLVKAKKEEIKVSLDSTCLHIKDVEYESFVDSITKVRMEYIKEILE